MSVKVTGLNELLAGLENKYGNKNMQAVIDRALVKGGQVFKSELEKEFNSFKDKGGSIEEINVSSPMTMSGVRTIKVSWKGPKGRYRIIHLNEFGTVKNPNPKGKGAIARAMRNAEDAYRRVVKEELGRG